MLYFDLDGVLAHYDPADYIGDPMPFEEKGIHYFRNRPIDYDAVELLDACCQSFGISNIGFVSTLSANAQLDAELLLEHVNDKIDWLWDVWYGILKHDITPRYHFAEQGTSTKSKVIMTAHDDILHADDVLIDDFNSNLADWRDAGGTAVKWLNGVNSRGSWDGPCAQPGHLAENLKMLRNTLGFSA